MIRCIFMYNCVQYMCLNKKWMIQMLITFVRAFYLAFLIAFQNDVILTKRLVDVFLIEFTTIFRSHIVRFFTSGNLQRLLGSRLYNILCQFFQTRIVSILSYACLRFLIDQTHNLIVYYRDPTSIDNENSNKTYIFCLI